MGFLRRGSAQSAAAFWNEAHLAPGETPIEYAHLTLVYADGEEIDGTAFITDRRFLFINGTTGERFDCVLALVDGWLLNDKWRPGQVGIAIGFNLEMGAEPTLVNFFPQRRARANQVLAHQFYEAFANEFQRVHPDATPA